MGSQSILKSTDAGATRARMSSSPAARRTVSAVELGGGGIARRSDVTQENTCSDSIKKPHGIIQAAAVTSYYVATGHLEYPLRSTGGAKHCDRLSSSKFRWRYS